MYTRFTCLEWTPFCMQVLAEYHFFGLNSIWNSFCLILHFICMLSLWYLKFHCVHFCVRRLGFFGFFFFCYCMAWNDFHLIIVHLVFLIYFYWKYIARIQVINKPVCDFIDQHKWYTFIVSIRLGFHFNLFCNVPPLTQMFLSFIYLKHLQF